MMLLPILSHGYKFIFYNVFLHHDLSFLSEIIFLNIHSKEWFIWEMAEVISRLNFCYILASLSIADSLQVFYYFMLDFVKISK
jgi:hypothetical protein